MPKNIKFTIIVPTRERADTLLFCLRTIIAQNYDNFSIIVSDNYSQDDTKKVVDSFADPRIKYINTGSRISMSHNWEFALGLVKDGWIAIVGDDDGLLPDALTKVAEVIQESGCQAVTSKWCFYNWPNNTVSDNSLVVPLTSGYELRNGREWLGKLMRGDAIYPDLPCVYTGGFVDVLAINQARAESGEFFLSMTPDVYSAIALASVLDSYAMLYEPVAVAGTSSHSNGASTLGTGTNLIPGQKFFAEGNIPFHTMLAGGEKAKSIPIIVYECYLQSVHLHKDFLKVKLESQLGLALSSAALKNYAFLRQYCCEIASINGIDMTAVDRESRGMKKRVLLQRVRRAIQSFGRITLSGKDFDIRDVHGAVFLAKSTFTLKTRYAHWKVNSIFDLLKKFFYNRIS